MATAVSSTISDQIKTSPWEFSITCRLRGGGRVQLFISEQEAERLREELDEPRREGYVVFDSDIARHALSRKHLLLYNIRRHPGRRVSNAEEDLSLQIFFSDSKAAEKYAVESDSEDIDEEKTVRACQLQLLLLEAESDSSELFFHDDGGDDVSFWADEVALISIPLLHVIPSMKHESDSDEDAPLSEDL